MTLWIAALLMHLLPCSTSILVADHLETVQEYALVLGDLSVVAKRCEPVKVNWARLIAEGHLRGVCERDSLLLRDLARKRIDVVEASLKEEADVREWCGDALVGYGPGGMAIDGLLVP